MGERVSIRMNGGMVNTEIYEWKDKWVDSWMDECMNV